MNGGDSYQGEPPGPIAYMASNGVAANLLMLAIVAAGIVSFTGLDREAWPVLPFNTIEIGIPYPGASPDDIVESIVVKVEDEVTGLEGVKAVRSAAAPGMASVRIEMNSGIDMDRALDDVESAVARIQTLPADAERPRIREMTDRRSTLRLVLYGDVPERSLKELAVQVEEELAALPAVSLVEVSGARNYEISIEAPLGNLRAHGLTLDDIADAVGASSLDLSAGSIDTSESQVRVRTLGQRYRQHEFEDIVILERDDGAIVRLADIAAVRDGFQENGLIVRHQRQPAVFVEVFKSDSERIMDVVSAVKAHLSERVEPSLPPGVSLSVWNDDSVMYSERVGLLLKNGALGLLLVFVALMLFLEMRLALWVVAGLATTFTGALAVLLIMDISISTISLFVFVLAIGIVVDDAIVVAESIHNERMKGIPGTLAAIRGTRRITRPIIFAILTSIAAFMPLLYIPGGVGEIWRPLPVIVIGILLISLVESLFVLPSHLSHLPGPDHKPTNPIERFLAMTHGAVDSALREFTNGPLDRMLRFAVAQPLIVVSGAIGALILSVALIPAGVVATTFADIVEGDLVVATLEMPAGTTSQSTFEQALEIEEAGLRVVERLSAQQGEDARTLLAGSTVVVGQPPRRESGTVTADPTLNPEANLAAIEMKLVSAQFRDASAIGVAQAWRDEVGFLPNARSLAISGEAISFGNPLEAVLTHPDPEVLGEIAERLVSGLRGIEGVFDVRSDHASVVPEIQFSLLPDGRALGLTDRELARQARSAIHGAEALRIQRGSEEVKVLVRLPLDERNDITDIEEYTVRLPGGSDAPLRQVASATLAPAATAIRREDRRLAATVSADVDSAVISAAAANAIMANEILAGLAEEYPALSYFYGGEQARTVETLDTLYRGFAVAMVLIFILLAIPLRSYTQPFVVMGIIPFGIIGVILGHWVLGVAVGASTIMGVLGLSGVLVNDSLVMIDGIDQRLRDGQSPGDAIIEGAKRRFRPILLTSLTTFLGFTPMILEPATQAQFLRPFAASLGIGILVATVILMLVVPALAKIHLGIFQFADSPAAGSATGAG